MLLGLRVGWDIPIWDEIAAAGGLPPPPENEDGETPEEARRSALFDRWRGAAFEAGGGCVPLALVPPSEVAAEIADFLEEAGDHAGGIEEIRDFVSMARGEAVGEEVVCRPEFIGDGLELSMYTEGGRFLDSLTLPAERMPAAAGETLSLIESFVRLVKDPAGR